MYTQRHIPHSPIKSNYKCLKNERLIQVQVFSSRVNDDSSMPNASAEKKQQRGPTSNLTENTNANSKILPLSKLHENQAAYLNIHSSVEIFTHQYFFMTNHRQPLLFYFSANPVPTCRINHPFHNIHVYTLCML